MSGIPKLRLLLYGVAIIALIGAIWLRQSSAPGDGLAQVVERPVAPIRVPALQVARDIKPAGGIGARDIFRAGPKVAVEPVIAATPAQTTQVKRADPIEIAIEQAKRSMDAVKLIGVVASGEGALAVFEYDGNTQSRAVGDQIVSGFKLERISQNEIRARHERLGLVAILSLGGVRPMQWTRVE